VRRPVGRDLEAAVDLNTVTAVVQRPSPADWQPGDAWLAGGTSLFAEPQPHLRRLLDLTTLGWPALEATGDGLTIAATCTVAELRQVGHPLVEQCCQAFLASFKIWNEATVGGNLGSALPAGPMISLTAALDGVCEIWRPAGEPRFVPVVDLIVGDSRTSLGPGELIRSIRLPHAALGARTAFRQESLTTLGRSAALLIGRVDADGGFVLTVTASVKRPVQLRFPAVPDDVTAEIGAIKDHLYHDDVHGDPRWRRHLTLLLAEQIRRELFS
jgi:CO/xanthine dehydrogenase FAD-binding subunit